ncbi:hypothetical protein J2Z34_003428 [Youngiibacter multivorans]|uniref:Uncharacterized protein n=1 Tax=Youngiibacter multivorans TaxID=937251 RepID=A0ABS4G8L7_9CLOT|nr:hypothetical protein [Youngiibacter multivorans]
MEEIQMLPHFVLHVLDSLAALVADRTLELGINLEVYV